MFVICFVQIRLRQQRDQVKLPVTFLINYNISGKNITTHESTTLRPTAEKLISGIPTVVLKENNFLTSHPLLLHLRISLRGSPLSFHRIHILNHQRVLMSQSLLLDNQGMGYDVSTVFLPKSCKISFVHLYDGNIVKSSATSSTATILLQFVSTMFDAEDMVDSKWVSL